MTKHTSLFVNCFERDYRQVLSPGFMFRKAAQFRYPFARSVVTINNVQDRKDALKLAGHAVERGEITEFLEVEKSLPEALEICGIKPRHLGKVRHYLDFALVAVVRAAPDFSSPSPRQSPFVLCGSGSP